MDGKQCVPSLCFPFFWLKKERLATIYPWMHAFILHHDHEHSVGQVGGQNVGVWIKRSSIDLGTHSLTQDRSLFDPVHLVETSKRIDIFFPMCSFLSFSRASRFQNFQFLKGSIHVDSSFIERTCIVTRSRGSIRKQSRLLYFNKI